MIDLTQTVFIVAVLNGERLAILGGGNDQAEAETMARLIHDAVLLRAEPVDLADQDARP